MAVAVMLTCYTAYAALSQRPVVQRWPAWPPVNADPRFRWVDGESSGPLGTHVDSFFEERFREKLAHEAGVPAADAPRGFQGIVYLSHQLVKQARWGPAGVEAASVRVLRGLFPNFPPAPPTEVGLLYWFRILFARPFPIWSARLNAWVTCWAAQWLMGPCTLEDLDPEDVFQPGGVGGTGEKQQVVVHRCRFLEEAKCASVCVNACKMPTQAFFSREMEIPLRIKPDYETLQCRFQFGVQPTAEDEMEARSVDCFAACPLGTSLSTRCAGSDSA